MKYISFELTMPNVGSWNGKWTGADRKYYVIKSVCEKSFKDDYLKLLDGKESESWYYNFGDGWGANVHLEIIDSKEAKLRRKKSKGFAGYDWMINEILIHGRILERDERIQLRKKEEIDGVKIETL
jgi:hypothetical protein